MKVQDLFTVDRPREKLIHYGPQRLKQYELLAIILGSGSKNESVIDISKKAIKKILHSTVDPTLEMFLAIRGIGKVKASQILACIELGKRFISEETVAPILTPQEIWNDLKGIRKNKKEHFIVFYLDVRNRLIGKEIVSIGTLNASLVHPREVFEPAVRLLSAQIILSHNHPSGDKEPSDEDIKITKQLIQAGKILGIEILDHVIVSEEGYTSLREQGWV